MNLKLFVSRSISLFLIDFTNPSSYLIENRLAEERARAEEAERVRLQQKREMELRFQRENEQKEREYQ